MIPVILSRLIKVFTLLLVCYTNVSAQNWMNSPVYHGRNVYDLELINRVKIISGGGNEQNDSLQDIFRSASGGLVWDFSSNQGGGYIRSIDFIDSVNGLAVGYAGKILKTTDGAVSWSQVYGSAPVSQRNFTAVNYLSAQTALAFGGRNYLNDTIQTVIKSSNGGDSWTVLRDVTGRWLKGAYFINTTTGFAVGGAGTIIKTTDGGNNWTPVNSPIHNRDFNCVYFNNSTTGYIAGGSFVEFDTLTSVRTLLKTTDGGNTWNIVMDEPGGWLTSIDFIDQSIGYIVGDGAQLYKTTNGGANWIRQIIPISEWFTNFTSVKFLSPDFGAVGGMYGDVYLYSNEQLPEITTLPATVISVTDTNAVVTLKANINTYNIPAFYNFVYSTVPDFSSDVGFVFWPLYQPLLTSNLPSTVEASVNVLLPDTIYYYYTTTTTPNGTVYGDTLSFSTMLSFTEFLTVSPVYLQANSVSLNGAVAGFTAPVSLLFEYGTQPVFGNEIQASPGLVTDNSPYQVSVTLNSLADGYYYYRLKGITATDTFYANTLGFLVGQAFQTFQTLPATAVDLTEGTINGFIEGQALPEATISFEYGSTPSLGSEVLASPSVINDNGSHNISLTLTGLQPSEVVYYRLKAQTSYGLFFGEILNFVTGFNNATFEADAATYVSSTTARLNAEIENITLSTNLVFEYGTTPALGSSISANLSVLNDSLCHRVYADLTGLQPGTVYYYRLKADFQGSFNLYTQVRQVFTAQPEIPNWDFQNWETNTSSTPLVWNLPTDNFEQVPGVSGNALKIYGKNIALLGLIKGGDNNGLDFYNGCPINSRPDSMIVYLNYSLDSADTAIIFLNFSNQGVSVSDNFYIVSGNSGGSFTRYAFPIVYQNQLVPDTFAMLITPWIFFHEQAEPHSENSFIIMDDFSFSGSADAVCNGDFEDWFTFDHLDLQTWSYPKHVIIDTTDIATSRIVTQSVFEQPDDYAAKISSIAAAGSWLGGSISTLDDNFTHNASGPSFAVSKRFSYVNGYYKYQPENSDTAFFVISFFKNGQQIGEAIFKPTQTMSEYLPLDIKINYFTDTIIPDSADIVIVSSSEPPVGASVLYVDKLSFDGFWGSNGGIIESMPQMKQTYIKVYPNPAKNKVMVDLSVAAAEPALLLITDMNGRTIKQILFAPGQTRFVIDVADFNSGLYFLSMNADNNIYNTKIVVVK